MRALFFVLALSFAVPIAAAQPAQDEARTAFANGREAFDAARYEEALAEFRRAYRLSGRPELLYNAGLAADRLRRDPEAIEAYEAYLRDVPDAANREQVEDRLRLLHRDISPVAAANAAEPEPEPEGSSIVESPVFWVATGAAVVAIAVIAIVVATSGDELADPTQGDIGGVVFTLGGP